MKGSHFESFVDTQSSLLTVLRRLLEADF